MRVDFVKLLLGVFSSALICYALDTFFTPVDRFMFVSVTFGLMAVMSSFAVGIKYELPRTGTYMRMISSFGFLAFFIANTLMFWRGSGVEMFAILNGALSVVFSFSLITVFRARQ